MNTHYIDVFAGVAPIGSEHSVLEVAHRNKKTTLSIERVVRCLTGANTPGRTRTGNPLVKSQLLYQLSYGCGNEDSVSCAPGNP